MYTQEQLEAMSDFEINKLVAIKSGHKCYYDNGSFTNGLCGSGVIVKGNGIVGEVNYCNSWENMGPIAMDNNIVITPCMGINKGDATRYFEHENSVCSEFSDNKEALRAAAIVYLMVD